MTKKLTDLECMKESRDFWMKAAEDENKEAERLRKENMELREVLGPFALFARPAALEIAGGDDDAILATVVKHEHQALCWGAFMSAREVWDNLEPVQPVWPGGCQDPNSCSHHKRCMYLKCAHEGQQISPIKENPDG